jgi:hypothetical protein
MKWYADQTQQFGQLMAKAFINQQTHQTVIASLMGRFDLKLKALSRSRASS